MRTNAYLPCFPACRRLAVVTMIVSVCSVFVLIAVSFVGDAASTRELPPELPPLPPRPTGGLALSERLPMDQVNTLLRKEHPLQPAWSFGTRSSRRRNATAGKQKRLRKDYSWCNGSEEECYGEVTEEGFEAVLQAMPGVGSPCALTADARFLDVGCGFGRLAMYVALRSNVSKVTGIESNMCRLDHAQHGMAQIERAAPGTLTPRLRLIHGDVRKLTTLADTTHVFLSIQCWPADLIRTIVRDLARRTPALRCMIFSARGVPSLLAGANGRLVDEWGVVSQASFDVPTTWGSTEAVFVSKRAPGGAPADETQAARQACVQARGQRGPCASIMNVPRPEFDFAW